LNGEDPFDKSSSPSLGSSSEEEKAIAEKAKAIAKIFLKTERSGMNK
jgi:hypothetical protein